VIIALKPANGRLRRAGTEEFASAALWADENTHELPGCRKDSYREPGVLRSH